MNNKTTLEKTKYVQLPRTISNTLRSTTAAEDNERWRATNKLTKPTRSLKNDRFGDKNQMTDINYYWTWYPGQEL